MESYLLKIKWLRCSLDLNPGSRLLEDVLNLCAILPLKRMMSTVCFALLALQVVDFCYAHEYFCFHWLACTKSCLSPNLSLIMELVIVITYFN